MKIAVIGCGLFGSIIGAELAHCGPNVTWFDDGRPMAGSKPAACLIKPSWLSSMTKPQIDDALELLDRLYGVRELTFNTGLPSPLGTTTIRWVDPRQVLTWPGSKHNVKVTGIKVLGDNRFNIHSEGAVFGETFDRVVVCTGYWAGHELVSHMHNHVVKGQVGAAMLWPKITRDVFPNKIKVWAPYKQLVAFDRGDGIWCGDGSAIIPENWSAERQLQTMQREAHFVERSVTSGSVLVGTRPYVKLDKKVPCLVEQLSPGLWLATGGAKNGTMAAAWAAERVRDQL